MQRLWAKTPSAIRRKVFLLPQRFGSKENCEGKQKGRLTFKPIDVMLVSSPMTVITTTKRK
jgi:hypothetical protein